MEYEGIINLLKPAGMTSHDGVYFLRKLSGIKRIGHTGTLDPMAVGVLPLCIGNATRIMDYLDMDDKEYRCEMILGVETDTQDIWGTILKDCRDSVNVIEEEVLRKAFAPYSGEIFQLPPGFSAVRIHGKHLYEYARKGQEVIVDPRPVIIRSLNLVEFDQNSARVTFDVKCSKGTYIRSICHDIGKTLGCGGAMSFLARRASGTFRVENSVTLEELKRGWKTFLLPVDYPLGHFGKLTIPANRVDWFSNGGYLRLDEVEVSRQPSIKEISKHIKTREGLERAFNVYCGERFLGVVLYNEDRKQFIADKVFCR